MGSVFADEYSRFLEISDLEPQPERTNERFDALFLSNRDIFEGARVLDLASHDGRYSFAALKAGAAHVTGVEVRESLVEKARETFEFYGQDPSTYRFLSGDLFEVLASEEFEVDVVLCLGFLYHTYRHTELMYRLHHLGPTHLIMDTMVIPSRQPFVKVLYEETSDDIRSAASDPWAVDRVLVARPSVSALQLLMENYGFEIESMYDWRGRLAGRPTPPGLRGYANGKRVTLRCRSRAAARAAGWAPVAPFRPEAPQPRVAAPEQSSSVGWRDRVNTALARTTGYELRRTTGKR